jgi:oligopeptidase B
MLPVLLLGAPQVERLRTVALPHAATQLRSGGNIDYEATAFNVWASSPTSPEALWSIDLQPPHAVTEVQRAHSSSSSSSSSAGLVCMRLEARTGEGTAVPLTVAHRQGLARDGSHPLLLTVYGAYGMFADAGFQPKRLSLLERG